MDKHIKKFIGNMFDFTVKSEYDFRELYGFTFVFRRDIVIMNDQMTSAEIQPVGIIYEENGQYYYAPLHGSDEIEDIVQEFVKKI